MLEAEVVSVKRFRLFPVEAVAPVYLHKVSPDMAVPWPRPTGLIVTREGDTFRAFSSRSTHRGCPVDLWETGDRLYDVCSHAFWNLRGEPIAGPAPRGLDWYPVTVRNGWVEVDLVQIRKGVR